MLFFKEKNSLVCVFTLLEEVSQTSMREHFMKTVIIQKTLKIFVKNATTDVRKGHKDTFALITGN